MFVISQYCLIFLDFWRRSKLIKMASHFLMQPSAAKMAYHFLMRHSAAKMASRDVMTSRDAKVGLPARTGKSNNLPQICEILPAKPSADSLGPIRKVYEIYAQGLLQDFLGPSKYEIHPKSICKSMCIFLLGWDTDCFFDQALFS